MAVSARPRKQAVVIVHGMGEQRPLATLRSFVDAVWATDLDLSKIRRTRPNWPGSYELRRVTTPENDAGYRTDFYEFYWADIMSG